MGESLEKAVEEMMSQLDKKFFLPTLKNASLCQAKCCDVATNRTQLQNCMQQCNDPVQQIQVSMDAHLKEFQERLQRCVMRCQDEAKESLPVNPSQQQIVQAQDKVTKCADGCANQFRKKVPKLKADIEARLK
ncbi:hypothetical protein BSKO_06620 [Bryopsis sp. KO-2023]|nr:hypothetical protein BSKO_06620 [Bryopsis sp. KO-2023]